MHRAAQMVLCENQFLQHEQPHHQCGELSLHVVRRLTQAKLRRHPMQDIFEMRQMGLGHLLNEVEKLVVQVIKRDVDQCRTSLDNATIKVVLLKRCAHTPRTSILWDLATMQTQLSWRSYRVTATILLSQLVH